MDTMIKNVNCGVKYKYDTYFLEYTNFNDDLIEYKCLCCNNHYQQKFDEKLLMDTNFLTMIKISLFYCWENVWLLWIYGWLEKNQLNIITCKRRFLQSFRYGRYYWCRLCARQKSLKRSWNKSFKRISWFVCSKRYIIVSWCIWELSKYVELYELDPAHFHSAPGLAW